MCATTRRSRSRTTSSRRPTPSSTRGQLHRETVAARDNGEPKVDAPRAGHADGRLAEPARVGGRRADSVSGERRRQPRADGLEHAAPGRAAAAHRLAAGRHRHRAAGGSGLGRGVTARHPGVVESVDAERIVIRPDSRDDQLFVKPDIYKLTKFARSNQATCINQKPIVSVGDRVEKGRWSPTGPRPARRTRAGAQHHRRVHALGGLQLRGLDPDQRALVKEDVYTSVHIEEFECTARDTKLGPEEITRDIPNVGEDALGPRRRPGSCASGPRSPRGTSWSARSRPRARRSCLRRRSCCARSLARRPAMCATPRCGCRRARPGRSSARKVFARQGADKDDRSRRSRTPRRPSCSRIRTTRSASCATRRTARSGTCSPGRRSTPRCR